MQNSCGEIIFVGFYGLLYYRDPDIYHVNAWVDVVYEKNKSG